MQEVKPYHPKYKIRIVTAASLFDGHDAAINIMRRIIQASGAEVIHLGHNRSVAEIVNCAIEEDANAIALTSYQGGHIEFFQYMYDLLREKDCGHIKIFGGGGGTILPSEIEMLHAYGIDRIYSPDDGRAMGLQGMINDLLQKCDFPTGNNISFSEEALKRKGHKQIGQLISCAENFPEEFIKLKPHLSNTESTIPILGITGTGGAGKSSLTDELVRRFMLDFPDKTIAIISVDPSRRKTGGALLGDRIRMNSINNERVYMRSMATRQTNASISKDVTDAIDIFKAAGYDLILVETSGIGQSGTEIVDIADVYMYVMTPEFGAASQLEKIDMLDFADIVAINKFDKRGAQDALRDVKKQYQRNRNLWDKHPDDMPVFGSIAAQFNDPGTNELYLHLVKTIAAKCNLDWKSTLSLRTGSSEKIYIIPPSRIRYLSDITKTNRDYDAWVIEQGEIANQLYAIDKLKSMFNVQWSKDKEVIDNGLSNIDKELKLKLHPECRQILENWEKTKQDYKNESYVFKVRDKELRIKTHTESLSHLQIPKVSLPKYEAWGDILKWNLQENVPGEFPYTAGVFPFKRENEDPTRMFAGEGGPERTNKRFHYVSLGLPAKRLSTAFDSVTLYGNNPDLRPDIYGKIGNSGVSICTLDDAKKLYSGFDLCSPNTSVSMTINGPAPTICAFFMNAAIDQQCEKYIREHNLVEEVNRKIEDIYKEKMQNGQHIMVTCRKEMMDWV
ncbi:MAG: methylmalonyl-CoA mutase family protein [Chitinophagales bacterium]